MSKLPIGPEWAVAAMKANLNRAYGRSAWKSVGPGLAACQFCNKVISTNALARASHERSRAHRAAIAKAAGES